MKHYKNFTIENNKGTHIARQDGVIIGTSTKEHHLYQVVWMKDGEEGKNAFIDENTFKGKQCSIKS